MSSGKQGSYYAMAADGGRGSGALGGGMSTRGGSGGGSGGGHLGELGELGERGNGGIYYF